MSKEAAAIGELRLIERIRRRADRQSRGVRLGIGDDCAILRSPPGCDLLVTTDFLLEGRHFRRDWHTPESAGHRCLARGLSDLAAMGAKPLAAFLSLALPSSLPRGWVDRFFKGLHAHADRYGIPLAGGDTAEAPGEWILADIVLVGSAPAGRALRRSGAQPGDLLYVTGALGGAAAELDVMRAGQARSPRTGSSADHPQRFPEPRLAVGQALLRRNLATACMDLSDGLSSDLAHLCRESRVSAEIVAAAVPIHPLAAHLPGRAGLDAALHGGEDYELLFTARPEVRLPTHIAGVAITHVGRILPSRKASPAILLLNAAGKRSPLAPAGWEHLTGRS